MKDVTVERMKTRLWQEADSCQDMTKFPEGQTITLKVDDAGGGKFIVLETKRWAIDVDNIDAFAKLLKNFMASAALLEEGNDERL